MGGVPVEPGTGWVLGMQGPNACTQGALCWQRWALLCVRRDGAASWPDLNLMTPGAAPGRWEQATVWLHLFGLTSHCPQGAPHPAAPGKSF